MSRIAFTIGVAVAVSTAACGPREGVVRVVDGRAVEGEYVPGEAYAAYLRGVVAEANGRNDEAAMAYLAAVGIGPRDPEPWTRLGALLCGRDPARGRDAIDRALRIDETYAPAWVARARCATDPKERARAAEKALAYAPRSDDALAPLLASDAPGPASQATERLTTERRESYGARLLAATLLNSTDADAWRGLAVWAREHGEAGVLARALVSLARLDPREHARIDASITRMAGEGAAVEARDAARGAIEATPRTPSALVARLAIDGALVARDPEGAKRLCRRAHITETIAAARALLLGMPDLALAIATPIALAEPRNDEARVVRALSARALHDRGALADSLVDADRVGTPLTTEAWLAMARAAAIDLGADEARGVLARLPRDLALGSADGDPLLVPIAVSLAASRVVDAGDLGPNGRVELAERRGESQSASLDSLDARHRLLVLARTRATSPETLLLARDLAPFRARDALVAVAFARLAIGGAPEVTASLDSLARFDPADALVAAAALDLALHGHDAGAIPMARRRLAAVACTPAEHARVVE